MNVYLSKKHKEIRKCFEDEGLTISEWAAAHGFNRGEVYAVLSGRVKGVRGRAHQIAVELGLKPDPHKSSETAGD
ncbi:DNA-binding protein [Thiolapillus sp.]|uniref:DNA-binding protein n=1 Tax=Thiolapillus sp. TaxID=2017437 RepID=UPI003AF64055